MPVNRSESSNSRKPAWTLGLRSAASRRLSMPLVAAILVSGALGACVSDQRYAYWILNDSDSDLLVDVREQAHDTYLVPPHA